jgi:LysR family transcriptional regulator, glycine cleavage system transcriptional activator
MAKRLPPLNALRAFDAAAKHLSFTKAADELCVTQAAVSHQVKALEEFLGTPLFIRRNRALLLTEEGQGYWPAIRDIFEKLADATDRVMAQGASGALTVSVIPTFAIQWLVPRLSHFSTLYPEIDVRLKAVDFDVDFMRDDVDVAIYYSDGNHSGCRVDCLMEEFLIPVCSPSLLLGDKPLSTPEDLKHHTLLHDESTVAWTKWLRHVGVKGISVTHGPVFSHSSMVLQAAAHGQGVAIGHSVLCQNDLDAGRLIRPFQETVLSGLSYDLVCPEAWAERPKIVAFREWIMDMVAKDQREKQFEPIPSD